MDPDYYGLMTFYIPYPALTQAYASVLLPWLTLQISVQQIVHEWETITVMESQKTSVQWLDPRTSLCGQKPQGEMGFLASSAQYFSNNVK